MSYCKGLLLRLLNMNNNTMSSYHPWHVPNR